VLISYNIVTLVALICANKVFLNKSLYTDNGTLTKYSLYLVC